jgi:hypothetical protein
MFIYVSFAERALQLLYEGAAKYENRCEHKKEVSTTACKKSPFACLKHFLAIKNKVFSMFHTSPFNNSL